MQAKRPDWDSYFFGIAEAVSARASCPRASVGAVLVSPDRSILATGYNGAPAGEPHCVDLGCRIGLDGNCTRAVHAEDNAVRWAKAHGVDLTGATAYVWGHEHACTNCAAILASYGVTRIVPGGRQGVSLRSLYNAQAVFTEKVLARRGFNPDALTKQQLVDFVREYVLYFHAEASEALDWANWKPHRTNGIDGVNVPELAFELVDMQKFVWGLARILGIPPDEFARLYWEKTKVVEQREAVEASK